MASNSNEFSRVGFVIRTWAIVSILMLAGCGATDSTERAATDHAGSKPVVASRSGAMRGFELDAPAVGSQHAYYRATWAVIVGIDRYADGKQWPALSHAAGDAREIHAMLRDELGFPEHQIQHFENEQATQQAIFAAIDRGLGTPGRVNADDLVLFYFAGHGIEQAQHGYLVAHDSIGNVPGKNYLAVDDLVARLQAIGCRHKCVILDSCYSGALFSASRQEPRDDSSNAAPTARDKRSADSLSEYLAEPVFLGLTAGRHRPVGDGDLLAGHSPFAATLLDVLRDRADVLRGKGDHRWPGGVFSFSSMATRVLERVGRVAGAESQEPKWGALATSAGNGDILFRPTIERLTPSEKRSRAAYAASVRQAQATLKSNVDEAENRLLACDESLRGWEWRHCLLRCRLNELIDDRQRLAGPVAGLVWSADGDQLVACSSPGKLAIRNCEQHTTQSPDLRGLFDVQAFVGTSDAKRFAVVHGDTLTLVAIEGNIRRATVCSDAFSKPDRPRLALVDDGRLLALGGGKDGLLRLWAVDWTAMQVKLLSNPMKFGASIEALAIDGEGKWLVAAAGNQLHVAALPLDAPVKSIDLSGRARIVALRAHEHRVAIVDERATVSVRDLSTGDETRAAQPVEPLPLQAAAIDDDLRRVALAAADGSIAVCETVAEPSRQTATKLPGHGARITQLAFNGRGQRLASSDHAGLVKLWQTSPAAATFVYSGHESSIGAVAIDRNHLIASGDAMGQIHLWRWQSESNDVKRVALLARSVEHQSAHEGAVRAAAFSPVAPILVTGGDDGVLRIWEVATGQLQRELGEGNPLLKCLAFSRDGRYIVAGYVDRKLRVWDTATKQSEPCFIFGNGGTDGQFHSYRIQGVTVFEPAQATGHDGTGPAVFSVSQGVEQLTGRPTLAEWIAWRATDGQVLFRMTSADTRNYGVVNRDEHAWATAVVSDAGSQWLASAGPNRFFTVWHAPTGRLMLQTAPVGGSGELYSTGVAFTVDGQRLAVATNRAVRMWDWQADKYAGDDESIVLELTEFSAGVSNVVFSPDDRLLAVISGSRIHLFAAPAVLRASR